MSADTTPVPPGGERSALRLQIRGRVQGVGYRWSMVAEARRLGLTGWVRNDADGSVQLEVQGPISRVDELHRWLHDGPTHAHVDEVSVHEVDPVNGEDEFRILA